MREPMWETNEQPLQVPWMADVVEINDLEELEQYRLAWNALLPQTPRASFFHTFDWLKTYWLFFGREQRLRVLVVRSEGKPIGIVPLCVRTDHFHVGNVRVLTYPLNDWGTWYGPIGPDSSACMFMAMKHLQETPRDWDMLDLRWSCTEPGQNDPTGRALRATGWQAERCDYQQTSIVQLEGTDWETYRAGLSKKWRHELGRSQRGLERDFQVRVERHRPRGANQDDSNPRWDLYDNCLDIAEQSWQGESTTGNTLSHGHVREFLRECHRLAAKLGMLDMLILKLDDQPAAFQYNYCFEGKLFGLRMGFDRGFAKRGVGKALMGWLLEDSFARGDRVIDMGIGDYDFKRRFRTDVETSQRYLYYPWQAWRGQSVRLSHWIKSCWTTEKKVAVKA
ncbi:MAG: GNAT family N-acetyltransferase [Planctomycetes bacterium]|nr:GNAT family N-acetyltransferase [Planctomycetota bacterium]